MPRAKAKQPSPWRNSIIRYADEAPESLLANPQNWRIHPREQTSALKGSLTEIGWIAPVIVNETTQHVVDGHARIGEAIARGEPTVPVAYVQLTEQQERLALATFDPIAAMAGTDQQMLDDLLADVGTDQPGLTELLESLASEQPKQLHEDDADLTPPAEPITKPGDLWLLGEHRLLCGDSTSADNVARLMGESTPDMVFSDPPYGIGIVSTAGTIGGPGIIDPGYYAPVIGDDSTATAISAAVFALAEWPQAVHIWWGGHYYADSLPVSSCWIVWDKENTGNFGDAELAWTNQKNCCADISPYVERPHESE